MKTVIHYFVKVIIPATIILILLAMAFLLLREMRRHSNIVNADSARQAGQPLPVSVYEANVAPIQPLIVGSCTTQPSKTVELASAINDIIITGSYFVEGDLVSEGQKLLELDKRQIQASISKAQDRIRWLNEEIRERASLVQYYKENRASGQSLEIDYRRALIDLIQAEGDRSTADEELTLAQVDLEKTDIISPVTGRVDIIAAKGEVARVNQTVATITVVNPMVANCVFDTSDYQFLMAKRNEGEVVLKGLDGYQFSGRFLQEAPLDPEAEQIDNLNWYFTINNDHLMVQANMTGFIRFTSTEEVLRIPAVALLNQNQNQAQVFRVNDTTANLVTVNTGQRASGFVAITSGLEPGDRVVVAGQLDLIDGDYVNPIDPRDVTFSYGQ
ncbi:efflux RND transporter periplasmic adaptor subunit [Alteromonas aestuariivivens]|uniref:Efflux RND transporter periplasmic adaptor subunit n=1 Tax=Alteromonas aestuariivivens TaxID=1938339 RepID=A0A3D8MBQ1_9ALTE|nr:efflux RND transporter periplasmic adaptor subunit [Alteromonas aestuariivivens]RDV27505.1 efflux RND transporter periplasmic adaptor subunit [Alteromonas aestuariivivens]